MVRTTPPAAQQLKVVRETLDGHAVVSLDGEVDAFTLHLLEAELSASAALRPSSSVIVDLSDVRFLGSCGISALVTHNQRLSSAGSAVRLVVAPEAPVMRALRIIGITEELPVFSNLPDALAAPD
jgi:anti-anti-sigma factor